MYDSKDSFFTALNEKRFLGKQTLLLADLSDEQLDKLTLIYPFPKNIERTIPNLKRELVHKLPKTDLHVHGEAGCLMDVDLARTLAKRNNVAFPEELLDDQNTWKYRGKVDFFQFLKDFLAISSLICTPDDVEEVAYAYYRNCFENNVIFALPGISWVQCKDKMTFVEFNEAYNRAIVRGMKDFGSVAILRLRYYLERHIEDTNLFNEIVDKIQNNPNPFITTIGLAGGEENHPLAHFEQYYEQFISLRQTPQKPWYFLTAHMEAHSDNKTIEEATKLLDWIAHGRNAADSLETISKMKSQGIMFEACPLSDVNVYPDIIPTLAEHKQFRALLDEGLVSLNSDDPGFFGDINKVYLQVFEQIQASFLQLLQCTLRGINPASPIALHHMEQFKKEHYLNYIQIRQAGELKIEFFMGYWELLPMLINKGIDTNLAQKLIVIDLKTSIEDLKLLKKEIPIEEQALLEKFTKLLQIKMKMEQVTSNILVKTESMFQDFANRSQIVYNQQTIQ